MTSRSTAVAAAWQSFWFREVPPHSLALLRISLGALGVLTVLTLTPVDTFWSTSGLTPAPGSGLGFREAVARSGYETHVAWVLFTGALAAFSCTMLGYQTRGAVAAAFAAMVGMTYWGPLPLNSGHYVASHLLFCLMWTGAGDVLSIDARRAGQRDHSRAAALQPVWPLRLMRLQVAIVYFNSGLGKLYNPAWREGSALHYVLQLNTFARFPSGLPPSLDWLTVAMTYVTLAWEIAFPLLLLHPVTRTAALLVGVLAHLGMALTMEVGLFSWVMIASYIAFLDPTSVARWWERLHVRSSVARRSPADSASRANIARF